ncbi:MAG: hypothetical protein AAFU73_16555 [Planctomycetota bacterium]
MSNALTGTLPALAVVLAPAALAQTVSPTMIESKNGPLCSGSPETYNVCITFPPDSTTELVDVFLLFDDTGSFASQVPAVTSVFNSVVSDLQAALPSVDFAFGVGRFEDYGGPGATFSNEDLDGRPFILNQAMLSTSAPTFAADIAAALANEAPGFGGDLPESSAAEALYQVALGLGFDGDGNGFNTDSGPAGALATQVSPGNSGDVPAYASYVGTGSGTEGGVGFRPGALRLVILATDICSVATFDAAIGVPATIDGTGSSEPVSAFACSSTTPGSDRFGFVSDSVNTGGNTIAGAIAPVGSATLPESIAALNAAGIRVIGLAPGGAPTSSPGPSSAPSVMLSALARLTGAVDDMGNELVFNIAGGAGPIASAIVDAVSTTTTTEFDLTVAPAGMPATLAFSSNPMVVPGVGPDETACFDVTFDPLMGYDGASFDLEFRDVASGAVFGTIPVEFSCKPVTGCFTLDFEMDAMGDQVPNGSELILRSNVFDGVAIGGFSVSGFNAAIFDTDPMGPNAASSDQDLLVGTGNALILQENGAQSSPGVYDDPDDDLAGGRFTIRFDNPVSVCSLDLIDIDLIDVQQAIIRVFDEDKRQRIYFVPGGFTEDIAAMGGTGVRTLDLTTIADQVGFMATATATEFVGFDETHVIGITVDLFGSGAIDNLSYEPAAAPAISR